MPQFVMHAKTLILKLVFCCLFTSLSGRTWTDTQGRNLDADYISSTETTVKVRRASDLQIFELQLSQLSQADLDFITEQQIADQGSLHTPNETEFTKFRDRLRGFKFGNRSIPAEYLGAMSIRENPLGTIPYWADGMSIGKDGQIILSSGNGTTPHMKLVTWTPESGPSDIIPLIYKKSEKGITAEERETDEANGRFWFFGGQIAHDRDGKVLFTLGACCDNGIFRVERTNPVHLKRLNTCISSSSLQVPPWDDRYAYIGRMNMIRKFKLSRNSASDEEVVFTIDGHDVYISNCLMLDEDTYILGLSLPTEEVDSRGLKISGRFVILVDREARGYYLLDDTNMGAMAMHPTTGQLLRVTASEGRKYKLNEFELQIEDTRIRRLLK